MSSITENKECFLALCGNISRNGIEGLVAWLNKSDFFEAPASRQYHGSYKGGLLQHSLNVHSELQRLIAAFPEVHVDPESATIVSLFHDLCKVNFYTTEKRNRKNASGQWETYEAYKIDERFKYGGHGSKSVYIVQTFMQLLPEEAVAINCHMGAFDGNAQSVGAAFEAYPLAWLLSVADQAATYIDECG